MKCNELKLITENYTGCHHLQIHKMTPEVRNVTPITLAVWHQYPDAATVFTRIIMHTLLAHTHVMITSQ